MQTLIVNEKSLLPALSLQIDSLAVEITRRCNLDCIHCLRGPSENRDIKLNVIRNLAERLHNENFSVGSLIITGGEPTMNLRGIKWLRKCFEDSGIEVDDFYLAINGQIITDNFMEEMNRYLDFCKSNEISMVQISDDIYHEKSDLLWRLEEKELYSIKSCGNRTHFPVIYEGNAKLNFDPRDCGRTINSPEKIECDLEYGRFAQDQNIYISIYGDIFTECDLSYETQRDLKEKSIPSFVGNIFENISLLDMTIRYNNHFKNNF